MYEYQSITINRHRTHWDVRIHTQRRRGDVGETVKLRLAIPKKPRAKNR